MRVVIDTNVLISALMVRATPPDRIYEGWRHGRFDLVCCERQLEEIKRVSRRPALRDRLRPTEVGRVVNEIRRLAVMCGLLPAVSASPDPDDDFLLAMAQAAGCEFIVTGDKSGLLALGRYGGTRIVTAREFLDLTQR